LNPNQSLPTVFQNLRSKSKEMGLNQLENKNSELKVLNENQ